MAEGNSKIEQEKKFYQETAAKLGSGNPEVIIRKLNELKDTGTVAILPLILDLLASHSTDRVRSEALHLVSDLKDQHCVPVITEYISRNKDKSYISDLISCCWQSSLDFSSHLPLFTDCFILGDYQVAIESFTVIEEMLWKTTETTISICKKLLSARENEINTAKKPLYNELQKLLEEGRSPNQEDYPDMYLQ